jgi:hypothetical protein
MNLEDIKPVSLDYDLNYLLALASKGDRWAQQQLQGNGYGDYQDTYNI